MGGIGKTELALQYAIAQFKQEQYPGGICWLRARGQEIATQIVTFAQTKLGLVLPDGLDEQGQVEYCWGNWREGDVLVVFDDVTEFDAVEPYLPPSDPKFKVLLTTRLNLGSSVQSLSIEELDEESALALLETLVGPERIQSQLEDAKTLCGWVGNLPLGLELLGRFLAKRLDWSFEKLVERLAAKKLAAKALIAKESGMTAQLGVAAALELSWVELSEAEQELACLLGMFAIAPVPWHLVEGCLSDQDKDDLEDIRDEGLIARNLLKRVEQSTYQLHQIVQEFFRIKLKESINKFGAINTSYCNAIVKIAQNIKNDLTIPLLEELRDIIPHLEEAVNRWDKTIKNEDWFFIYIGLGRFYNNVNSYNNALYWFEKCLTKSRTLLKINHKLTVKSLNQIGRFYLEQQLTGKAEIHYVEALNINKCFFGEDHLEIAVSIDNLASSKSKFHESETLYSKALEIRKKYLGDNHLDITISLYNLANLYFAEEKYDKAESLCFTSLNIYKENECETTIDYAYCMNLLASIYFKERSYGKATPLYLQALDIFKYSSKEATLNEAMISCNLALIYSQQYMSANLGSASKNEDGALLYKKAVDIYKYLLGDNNITLADSLTTRANLYLSNGCFDFAIPLFFQALEMYNSIEGEENLVTAERILYLAKILFKINQSERSEKLYLKALEIRKKFLEEEDQRILETLYCLAEYYFNEELYFLAESYYKKVIEISRRIFGEEDPFTIECTNNLTDSCSASIPAEQDLDLEMNLLFEVAIGYHETGRFSEAELHYLQALKIAEHVDSEGDSIINKITQCIDYCHQKTLLTVASDSLNTVDEEDRLYSLVIILEGLSKYYFSIRYYSRAEIFFTLALNDAKSILGSLYDEDNKNQENEDLLYLSKECRNIEHYLDYCRKAH